jgi:hypothetical protein
MARFAEDPGRLNYTTNPEGKELNLRLLQRAQAIFTTLLGLLPSNYLSSVQGPNYTNGLKAVAVELARLELALEDIDRDSAYATTRSDFLYSIVGYLVLLGGKLPAIAFSDEEFRRLLVAVIRIYFQGSIPASIRDAVALFISGEVTVSENFLLIRRGASGLNVSDQFGFQIDVACPGYFPPDVFAVDAALRQLIDVVRPAHTLYRIRYIFKDFYNPNSPIGKVLDAMRWHMADYRYDDFRSYWNGIRDRDRLGKKVNRSVMGEAHGDDF